MALSHWFGTTHLWHQILEARNDVGTFELLVVTKATSDDDNSNQGDGHTRTLRCAFVPLAESFRRLHAVHSEFKHTHTRTHKLRSNTPPQ